MKMSDGAYVRLRAAIMAQKTWAEYTEIRADYRSRGWSSQRFRWNMLHASGFDTVSLYKAGLNDDHIDTALRAIFYTLDANSS